MTTVQGARYDIGDILRRCRVESLAYSNYGSAVEEFHRAYRKGLAVLQDAAEREIHPAESVAMLRRFGAEVVAAERELSRMLAAAERQRMTEF